MSFSDDELHVDEINERIINNRSVYTKVCTKCGKTFIGKSVDKFGICDNCNRKDDLNV